MSTTKQRKITENFKRKTVRLTEASGFAAHATSARISARRLAGYRRASLLRF